MIRVHALAVHYPVGDGSQTRRTPLGVDLSLVPERVDVLQTVTKATREAWQLPSAARCVLRYDCSTHGYRVYILSDSRDAVERAMTDYRRFIASGGRTDAKIPDTLPEDL